MPPYLPTPKQAAAAEVYRKYFKDDQEPDSGYRSMVNYKHYVDTIAKDGWKWGKLGWTKQTPLPGLEDASYRPYTNLEE